MLLKGDEQSYVRASAWWREHPRALAVLCGADRVFKYLGYVAYPVLLVIDALVSPSNLVFDIIVPAVAFVLVSVFRRLVDAPRPYEVYTCSPLIYKDTKGRSFPSRHVFSMFMIALCWLCACLPVGVALLAIGCAIAWIRVVGGVHFLKDVLAGALFALAFWGIGLLAFSFFA